MSHKIMRLPEVIQMTGLSRSTIYLRMGKGSFPQTISLGERAVGWLLSDIEAWLDARVVASKAVDHV
ncbi:helix-turn-helix transcriptional regulator [Alteromonas confluentis]|uniref:AlpA family transcriptional regulator n=1 Tax=Alteromonas confluentis TaxID=1656094 RepID=A0A1E7ZBC1_9ALTE|nr:AlpA family transcriptional regulator [Alteromonas confluentis]OFC70826.1 AlpA family transcriptional regulator [Alteromonas confluentis]